MRWTCVACPCAPLAVLMSRWFSSSAACVERCTVSVIIGRPIFRHSCGKPLPRPPGRNRHAPKNKPRVDQMASAACRVLEAGDRDQHCSLARSRAAARRLPHASAPRVTALAAYAPTVGIASGRFLIESERSDGMSAQAIVNLFWRWYRHIGFDGCSSHSGRRTFITNTARKILTVGGSLRDVQMLAGHTNLRTTQRYIEANPEAQVRIVELV